MLQELRINVQLELDGGTRKAKLFPWQWVDPQHHQPVSPWQQARQWQRATPEAVSAAIHDSAILRYLAGALPHLAPQPGAKLVNASFALEKNPRSLAVVIAFFVLLLYALADTFVVGHETYVDAPPVSAFVAAGVLAAVAAAVWMLRAKVPTAEGMIVALLFGGALGAAGYPGALRINAITDADGVRTYEYQISRARVSWNRSPLACPPWPFRNTTSTGNSSRPARTTSSSCARAGSVSTSTCNR